MKTPEQEQIFKVIQGTYVVFDYVITKKIINVSATPKHFFEHTEDTPEPMLSLITRKETLKEDPPYFNDSMLDRYPLDVKNEESFLDEALQHAREITKQQLQEAS
jgi:hypothetical protein